MITSIKEFKLILESIGDISLDEIKTEKFNIDFRKKLDELFTKEPTTTADWAGIRAWKVSGETWDGYFVVDTTSYKGGNDYNNIDYELINCSEDTVIHANNFFVVRSFPNGKINIPQIVFDFYKNSIDDLNIKPYKNVYLSRKNSRGLIDSQKIETYFILKTPKHNERVAQPV